MADLPFAEAEKVGRHALSNNELEFLRQLFALSYSRMAGHLHTNTQTLKRWIDDPEFAGRIQATTAARIGQFCADLVALATKFGTQGIHVANLYPLSLLAGQLGRSLSSPAFTEMCQSGRITCHDMGILGTYIPVEQVEELKAAKRK
jgi:hypothetical protein